ncbi:MAG: glycosyltransferase [Campylobacteraceae bacterium]|jgi:lipopolysaccharide biosynthesis glycosyltransferase|nr:glycosyltransferase [Campylobacteraceae bacterium]
MPVAPVSPIEICFAINDQYVKHVITTAYSILHSNPNNIFRFHIVCDDLSCESRSSFSHLSFRFKGRCFFEYYTVDKSLFSNIKLTIDYISIHTYYRLTLADIFPKLDKVLYLDADILVQGDLLELWETKLEDNYAAGVSDLYIDIIGYKKEIGFGENDLYINGGVILFNLSAIRQDNMQEKLLLAAHELSDKVKFQDQDIINIVFKNRIKAVPDKFNFAVENMVKHKDAIDKAHILHYNGAKKPWHKKKNHLGYKQYHEAQKRAHKKLRAALLIDEFFGAANTAFGGYGFLARRYIAKYIPCADIEIDVLLGKGKRRFFAQKFSADGITLYRLPKRSFAAKYWLKRKNYDIYLSIELTDDYVLKHENNPDKKLILWIQDPRPKYEWDEIDTVKLFPESNYYRQAIYDLVHDWYEKGRVSFISQGYFLNPKALDLYNLPSDTTIKYLPNPVEIDEYFDVENYPKKNNIIFLGRIESVKRGWLFCEIAKKMPQYNFYMIGQTFRQKNENSTIINKYKDIPNLYFTGHLDGEEKTKHLKNAKILVNTSIHEALPISFLEALSYGTLIVSNRNPENLTEKFGVWVGDVLGDGFDKIDLYVNGIEKLMKNDKNRVKLAKEAIDYVKRIHNIPRFVGDLRNVVFEEAYK